MEKPAPKYKEGEKVICMARNNGKEIQDAVLIRRVWFNDFQKEWYYGVEWNRKQFGCTYVTTSEKKLVQLPKYNIGDKVLYMTEINGKETQIVADVIGGAKMTSIDQDYRWWYEIRFETDHGWCRARPMEYNLNPLRSSTSIYEALIEVATRINAENPDYICAVEKTEEGLYAGENMSVVFKCLATNPHLCEKRVISLCDSEDAIEKLPIFICTKFSEFKQTCEAHHRLENSRSGGKAAFMKALMNGVYGANGNVYKGGYLFDTASMYPDVKHIDERPVLFPTSHFDYEIFSAQFMGDFDHNAVAKLTLKEDKKMEYKETKKEKREREYNQTTPWNYRPKEVIYNGPATIIKWADGDKTVVKCGSKDKYDRELAFMYSLVKKDHYEDVREGDGEKETNYLRMFKKIYEKTNDPEAAFVTTLSHYILSDCGMDNDRIKRYFAVVKDKMDDEYRAMAKKLSAKHSKED